MNRPIWDDGDWEPLPRLEGVVRADVCVVGLGGSGLAALEELRALGVAAVGIDARTVGAGAAGRNGGFVLAGLAGFYHKVVAQLGREVAAPIYRETIAEIRRMANSMPGVLRLDGSLRMASDAAELDDCRAQLSALSRDGFPCEHYSGPEGEGLLIPTDGVFHPLRRVRMLARRLRAEGVLLFEASPARKLLPGQVVTDSGAVQCDSAIVAVDGRLERVVPELAQRVRTARLQMLATGPAPEVAFTRPIYWRYGYEYWQQLPDGRIALGGFRDKAPDEEWTLNAEPSESVQQMLERFLREKLRVKAPVTHRWAAGVAYTTDGLPVLDEIRPKFWVAGGYNGTGNIVGSLCGRAAARQACGQESEWAVLLQRARR